MCIPLGNLVYYFISPVYFVVLIITVAEKTPNWIKWVLSSRFNKHGCFHTSWHHLLFPVDVIQMFISYCISSLICGLKEINSLDMLLFSSLYGRIGAELQGREPILMFQRFLLTGSGVKTQWREHINLAVQHISTETINFSLNLRGTVSDTDSVFLMFSKQWANHHGDTFYRSNLTEAYRALSSSECRQVHLVRLARPSNCRRHQTSNAPLIVFPSEITSIWQTQGLRNWRLVSQDKSYSTHSSSLSHTHTHAEPIIQYTHLCSDVIMLSQWEITVVVICTRSLWQY